MAFRIEIIENAIVITDTITGVLKLDEPAKNVYYEHNILVTRGIYSLTINRGSIFSQPLSDCVDALNVPFTEATLQTFSRTYLGKSNGGGGSQPSPIITERVEFKEDLPTTVGSPAIDSVYLVDNPTWYSVLGVNIYKTAQSGEYIRDFDNGNLDDWRLLNKKVKFTDDSFAIVKTANQSVQAKYDLTSLTSNRTYQHQDKNGVIAHLDDVTSSIPEAPTDGVLYLRNGQSSEWIKQLGVVETFNIATKENNQNANNGDFQAILTPFQQGYYTNFTTVTNNLNLGSNQSFTLRCGVYSVDTLTKVSEGSLILTNINNINTHEITLDTPFNVNSPTSFYCCTGVNNNNGGGSFSILRINANSLNSIEVAFSFTQNTGLLPENLTNISQTNNVRYQIYYGQ